MFITVRGATSITRDCIPSISFPCTKICWCPSNHSDQYNQHSQWVTPCSFPSAIWDWDCLTFGLSRLIATAELQLKWTKIPVPLPSTPSDVLFGCVYRWHHQVHSHIDVPMLEELSLTDWSIMRAIDWSLVRAELWLTASWTTFTDAFNTAHQLGSN